MKKVQILCHDGKSYIANVEDDYTAADAVKDIIAADSLVAIGDVIIHKTNISRVVPVQE